MRDGNMATQGSPGWTLDRTQRAGRDGNMMRPAQAAKKEALPVHPITRKPVEEAADEMAKKPNIAETVDLSQVDDKRRAAYSELIEDVPSQKLTEDAPQGGPSQQLDRLVDKLVKEAEKRDVDSVQKQDEPKQNAPERVISEEDKQEFLRSVLGEKEFRKTYSLFGGKVRVTLRDRSPKLTEQLYNELQTNVLAGRHKVDTDEQWDVWVERYIAAAVYVAFESEGKGNGMGAVEKDKFFERVETIMEYPRPFYEGLMGAVREFEDQLDYMMSQAQNPSFWAAGGGA